MAGIDDKKYHIKCKFIHSATLEMVKSIHVIADPSHHVYCRDWAKTVEHRLSDRLREEIYFFAEQYGQWNFVMDLVAEVAYHRSDPNDLSAVLERIQKMNRLTFAVFFLGSSPNKADVEKIRKLVANPELAESSKDIPMDRKISREASVYFFQHLDDIRERLCNAMWRYWKEVFEYEWEAIDRYLMTVIKRGRALIERYGPINYICSLHDDMVVEDGVLRFNKEIALSIPLKDVREVVITPSVFAYPHLYGNVFQGKVYIALNMNYNGVKINESVPVDTLELLRILSDETRFRIIKALWTADATTSELAELLTISKTTVSLHLKQMKDAGLLEMKKTNQYAYYRLVKEPFYTIQKKLMDSLE